MKEKPKSQKSFLKNSAKYVAMKDINADNIKRRWLPKNYLLLEPEIREMTKEINLDLLLE